MKEAIQEAREFRDTLAGVGWRETPNGDLISEDSTVWAQTTYTHGEFTLTCSRRPKGSGRPEGVTHVRLTTLRAQRHPGVGRQLAHELVDFAEQPGAWPTRTWADQSSLT